MKSASGTDSGASIAAAPLPRRIFLAVALLAAAVMIFQIALNRIFSFTTWHHLAYISVSLALLGFGASGSLLVAFPWLGSQSLGRRLGLYSTLAGVSTVVALVIVGALPLDLEDVLERPGAIATLALYFFVISTPFAFAGLGIALALRGAGTRINELYFWDLVGAGLGCLLAVEVMNLLQTPRVLMLVALVFATAGVIATDVRSKPVLLANLGVGTLLLLLIVPLPRWLPFRPGPDKFIAPYFDGGTRYFTRWSALFRTDLIGARDGELAEQGGYRSGGISPRFEGASPPYRVIFHDGAAAALFYSVEDDDFTRFEMFRHHVLTVPYVLRVRPDVLVIGVGGGADIVNGLTNGAASIVGVELDPVTVDLITNEYRDFSGGVYERPDVSLQTSEGRHYLRSTGDAFDIIQLTGVDTLSALSSGAYIFAENYLYTVEAFSDFFRRLRPDGLLSIAAIDYHPRLGYSRHALRFAALSHAALRERGAERPSDHIMIVSTGEGITLFEVLTKLSPFSASEIEAMEAFLDREGLESWYLPGRPGRQVEAFRRLLEGSREAREGFFESTFLDLRPPTDNNPFFFSFYKWRHLFDHRDEIDPGHLLATGQLVLLLILVLAVLFSTAAIGLPLLRTGGSASRFPGRWQFLAYFAALGAGFIFAEICFVQRFLVFLGYPTYSLSVILFSFLTSAGIGAYASGRLPDDPRRVLPRLAVGFTVLVVLYLLATPAIFAALLSAPLSIRIAVTVALCGPLGGVLGTFFPYGIRLTAAVNRDFTAWAWAVNGCLTVVGSVVAVILATTYGFDTVIVLALGIYWLGVSSFLRGSRRVHPAWGRPA